MWRILFSTSTALVLAALCGCRSASITPPPAPAVDLSNACTVLSSDDIAGAIGGNVGKGSPTVSEIGYDSEHGGSYVNRDATGCTYGVSKTTTDKDASTTFEATVVNFSLMSPRGYQNEKGSTHSSQARPLSGLGNDAFWDGDTIYVLKNNIGFSVSIPYGNQGKSPLEAGIGLAQTALAHMPDKLTSEATPIALVRKDQGDGGNSTPTYNSPPSPSSEVTGWPEPSTQPHQASQPVQYSPASQPSTSAQPQPAPSTPSYPTQNAAANSSPVTTSPAPQGTAVANQPPSPSGQPSGQSTTPAQGYSQPSGQPTMPNSQPAGPSTMPNSQPSGQSTSPSQGYGQPAGQ